MCRAALQIATPITQLVVPVAAKLVPPSKPEVSKLSDTSVMLKWTVPANDGLTITFFKVQYKAMSGERAVRGGWRTIDADVASDMRMHEVSGLRPGGTYRFRVLAVYSNNDNKQGPNSKRFTLSVEPPHRPRPPGEGPVIVEARPQVHRIAIRWQVGAALSAYKVSLKPPPPPQGRGSRGGGATFCFSGMDMPVPPLNLAVTRHINIFPPKKKIVPAPLRHFDLTFSAFKLTLRKLKIFIAPTPQKSIMWLRICPPPPREDFPRNRCPSGY